MRPWCEGRAKVNEKPEILNLRSLPVVPITIGDMSFNRTGLWRYLMPVLRDRTAPCQQACPLGMPSPAFINDVVKKDLGLALSRIMAINPMPGITGRLCFHPCQAKCLRRGLDQAIQIQKLAKYVADSAPEPPDKAGEAEKGRVVVLGAGPLGLSAGYFLSLSGLQVTIVDPLGQPGGFLCGVAEDKLPAQVLDREINRMVKTAGLALHLNAKADVAGGLPQDAGLDLILLDKTAHAAGSQALAVLGRMAEAISPSRAVRDTDDLHPPGAYKASQVALAVAAGRALAAMALGEIGLQDEKQELENLSRAAESDAALGQEDIRFDLFEARGEDTAAQGESLTDDQALAEARQCLSCGHCNLCGRCLVFCPDVSLSVNEQTQRPQVDLQHCKGCGICAHECPRGAMVMER